MSTTRTVKIPETVLMTAQSLDDLEDWLASHDPESLRQMRRIRHEEDLAEQGKDLGQYHEDPRCP
ncbi:MAG: hypothetical protein WBE26_00585 [Phycisphaerae bacterium]